MKTTNLLASFAAGAALCFTGAAFAAPNGEGPDPDGDSNPAINSGLHARIGADAEARLDPPFKIATFEDGKHGAKIEEAKADSRTVKFSGGLTRQICKGVRHFRWDSQCTYLAAPSGDMAAGYRDNWGRPLKITFENPVCVAALAAYPTGGQEGERYELRLQPYDAAGEKLKEGVYAFEWTNDTFRWRLMALMSFRDPTTLAEVDAARVDVKIVSLTNPKKKVRFLIDDVAFIEEGAEGSVCQKAREDMQAEFGLAGAPPPVTDPVAPN